MKQLKQWIALALTAVMLGTSIPSQTLQVNAADTGTEEEENSGNQNQTQGEDLSDDNISQEPADSEETGGTDVGDGTEEDGQAESAENGDTVSTGDQGQTRGGEDGAGNADSGDQDNGDTEETVHTLVVQYALADSNGQIIQDSLSEFYTDSFTGDHITEELLCDKFHLADYDDYDEVFMIFFALGDLSEENIHNQRQLSSMEDIYALSVPQEEDTVSLGIGFRQKEAAETFDVAITVYNELTDESNVYHESVEYGNCLTLQDIPELDESGRIDNITVYYSESGEVENLSSLEDLRNKPVNENISVKIELIRRIPEAEDGYHTIVLTPVMDCYFSDHVHFAPLEQKQVQIPDGGSVTEDMLSGLIPDGSKINIIVVMEDNGNNLAQFDRIDGLYTYPVEKNAYVGLLYTASIDVTLNACGGVFDDGASIKVLENTPSSSLYGQINQYWPVKEGFTFCGWAPEPDCDPETYATASFAVAPADTMTLYAVWTEATTKLTLNPNGGAFRNGSEESLVFSVEAGKTVGNSYNTNYYYERYLQPVSEEGAFTAWNTKPDGSGETIYDPLEWYVYDSVTLYAVYDMEAVVVTFDANGGLFNMTLDNSDLFSGGGSALPCTLNKAPDDQVSESDVSSYFNGDSWTKRQNAVQWSAGNMLQSYMYDVENIPLRAGYAFAGWAIYTENGWEMADPNMQIEDDCIVYAQWTQEDIFTVSLHAAAYHFRNSPEDTILSFQVINGTVLNQVPYTITYTDSPLYDYEGLYLDAECSKVVPRGVIVNRNMDIYVNYVDSDAPNRYTVLFYDADPYEETPNLLDSCRVEEGKSIGEKAPADPVREGYRFLYWQNTNNYYFHYTDLSSYKVSGEETFFAVWEKLPYTYTIDAAGGTFPDTGEGTKVVLANGIDEIYTILWNIHNLPEREGYIFSDWDLETGRQEATEGEEETGYTIYAVWCPAEEAIPVTLHAGEGYFADGSDAYLTYYLPDSAFANFLDDMYWCPMCETGAFEGWSLTPDGGIDFYTLSDFDPWYGADSGDETINSDTVQPHHDLYAKYKEWPVVTFDANGGMLNWLQLGEATIRESEPQEITEDLHTISESDLLDRPNWTKITQVPRLSIVADYSSNEQIYYLSDYVYLLSTSPQREGYGFTGWYTDPACTEKANLSDAVEGSRTVYAGWDENCAYITVKALGGCFNNDPSVKEISFYAAKGEPLPQIPYITYQTSNMLNAGMYFDAEGNDPVMGNYVVEGDEVTIYLIFANYYAVFLNAGNGRFSQDASYYGNYPGYNNGSVYVYRTDGDINIRNLPTPESNISGLLFKGWYFDEELSQPVGDNEHYYSYGEIRGRTLYAKYDVPITVTLHLGPGYYEDSSVHEYQVLMAAGTEIGNAASYPGDPYAPNMDFYGWYYDEELTQLCGQNIYGVRFDTDTDLYAKMTPWPTVVFDANGKGYFDNDQSKTTYSITLSGKQSIGSNYSQAQSRLRAFDPDHYKLEGWYTDRECTHKVTSWWSVYPADTPVLYARWVEQKTLTFHAGDGGSFNGEESMSFTVWEGDYVRYNAQTATDAISVNDPNKKVFCGWSTDPDAPYSSASTASNLYWNSIVDDTDYYAIYRTYYAITFDLGNYGTTEDQTEFSVLEGEYLTTQAESIHVTNVDANSQVFIGWSETENGSLIRSFGFSQYKVSGDTTYYAVYKNVYKITFSVGEYGTTENQTVFYVPEGEYVSDQAESITVTDTDPHSKHFSGWSETENGSLISSFSFSQYQVTEDKTYYAVYKNVYKVTFKSGDHGYFGYDENGDEITELTDYFVSGSNIKTLANQAFSTLITKDDGGRWERSGKWSNYVESSYVFTSRGVSSDLTFTAGYTRYYFLTFQSGDHAVFGTDEEGNEIKEKVYRVPSGNNKITYADTAQNLLTYNPDRYIFAGWSPDGTVENIRNLNSVAASDETYIAAFYPKREIRFTAGSEGYGSFEGRDGDYVTYVREGDPYTYAATYATNMIRNTDEKQHVFAGWAAEGSDEIIGNFIGCTAGEEDVVYHAVYKNVWEIKFSTDEYGSFESDDGEAADTCSVYVTEGESLAEAAAQITEKLTSSDDLHRYLGWSTEAGSREVISDFSTEVSRQGAHYYVVWKEIFDVTLYANGGSIGDDNKTSLTVQIVDGDSLGDFVPADEDMHPESIWYVFEGWSTSRSAEDMVEDPAQLLVTQNTSYYAIWKNVYRITFDAGENGYFNGDPNVTTVSEMIPSGDQISTIVSQAATIQAVGRKKFVGWYESTDAEQKDVVFGENETSEYTVTYNARYVNLWDITFLPGESRFADGIESLVKQIEENEPISAAAQEAEAQLVGSFTDESGQKWVFDCWTDESGADVTPTNELVLGDAAYTAKYKKAYTITFEAGGGYFSSADENVMTFEVAEDTNLYTAYREANSAVHRDTDRYQFGSWMASDGTTYTSTTFSRTNPASDMTFTAQWKYLYHITLHANKHGTVARYSTVYGDSHLIRIAEGGYIPNVLSGYKGIPQDAHAYGFAGWNTDPDAYEVQSFGNVSGDMDLYAVWRPVYPVTMVATYADNEDAYIGADENQHSYTEYVMEGYSLSYAARQLKANAKSSRLEFDCWYKDEARTEKAVLTEAVTGPVTYYAGYTFQFYITFDAKGEGTFGEGGSGFYLCRIGDGSAVKPFADEAQAALVLNESSAYDKTFDCWCKDEECTQPVTDWSQEIAGRNVLDREEDSTDGDWTYYARYKRIYHIPVYAGGKGHFDEDKDQIVIDVAEGESLKAELEAARARLKEKDDEVNSIFKGWSLNAADENEVISDTDVIICDGTITGIYANYEDCYAITAELQAQDARFEDGRTERTFRARKSNGGFIETEPERPTRPGKGFGGWFVDPECTREFDYRTYRFTDNGKIYASWVDIYTVAYESNGHGDFAEGVISTFEGVVSGDTVGSRIPSSNPVPEGNYSFRGWGVNGPDGEDIIGSVSSYIILDNTTFYARWQKYNVITYDANGGSFPGGNASKQYNVYDGKRILSNVPANPNPPGPDYEFVGWAGEDNEVVTNLKSIMPAGDMTFTAVWKKKFAVTFHAEGGIFEDRNGSDTQRTVYISEDGDYELAEVEAYLTNTAAHTAFGGWYYIDGDEHKSIETFDGYSDGRLSVSSDAEFYAQWQSGYTITVHTGEGRYGDVTQTYINVPAGNAVGDSPRAEIFDQITYVNSKKFLKGWSETDGGEIMYADSAAVRAIRPARDMDLYAVSGNSYTVQVMNEGNTAVYSTTIVKEGYELGRVRVPSSSDPTMYLAGLGTEVNGGYVERYWDMPITQDTVLYPYWAPKYVVTLNGNGGLLNGQESIVYYVTPGSSLGVNENSITKTQEGKVFKAFYDNAEGEGNRVYLTGLVPSGDMTCYAKWADTYTITYHANGGYFADGSDTAVIYIEKMARYSSITEPEVYTTDNAVFAGWMKDGHLTEAFKYDKVTQNWVIEASWSDDYYTVTLNAGNGYFKDGSGRKADRKVIKGSTLSATGNLPTPYASNEMFDGWYTEADGGTKVLSDEEEYRTYLPEADVTLYARYQPYYTIEFDANGGNFGTTDVMDFERVLRNRRLSSLSTLVTPVREGYAFTGWYEIGDPGTKVSLSTAVTSDMVLKAGWTQDAYTVTFDPGTKAVFRSPFRGMAETGTRLIDKGASIGDLAPVLVPEDGYYLEGWYFDAERTQKINSIRYYYPDGDSTVYANIVKYINVTFDANGGFYDNDSSNVSSVERLMAGATIMSNSKARLSRYDHEGVFVPAGWFDENGNELTSDMRAEEDATYYIKWIVRPAEIQKHPENFTGKLNTQASFTVEAVGVDGETLSYQWQYCYANSNTWRKTTVSGNTTDTITMKVNTERDGVRYRCVIRDEQGNEVISNPATLYLLPVITLQPKDEIIKEGEAAAFTVKTTGTHNTYTWETAEAGTDDWHVLEGQTSNICSVVMGAADDGRQYRCIITGLDGTELVSQTACTYLNLDINDGPDDVYEFIGKTAVFSVILNKETAGASYRWQYMKKGGTSWGNTTLEGYTTDTLKVPVTLARDGMQFRCIIRYQGSTITSEAAALHSRLAITQQPQANNSEAGDTVKLAIKAEGIGVTYQWQSSNNDKDWTDCTGQNRSTMSVPVSAAGSYYRCIVRDTYGTVCESESVRIEVGLLITGQPEDVSGMLNDTVSLAVEALGVDLIYRWQKQNSEEQWVDVEGASESTLSIIITEETIGIYHCIVTDGSGNSAVSGPARVAEFGVSNGPEDSRASIGEKAVFTVSAYGENLAYQWWYRAKGTGTWSKVSASFGGNTDTIRLSVAASKEGMEVYCTVKDSLGHTKETDPAKIIVKPEVIDGPADANAAAGETVTFGISATGIGLTYQWYSRQDGNDWEPVTGAAGATTRTLKMTVTEEDFTRQFRCKVLSSNGTYVESDPAVVHKKPVIQNQTGSVEIVPDDEHFTLSVTAEGSGLSYQWQILKGSLWTDLDIEGAKEHEVTIAAADDNYGQYRCLITDEFEGVTVTDVISAAPGIKIETYPVAASGVVDTQAEFHVSAEGKGLSYQWYYQMPNSQTWGKVSAAYGGNTDTISLTIKASKNGMKVYCVITDAYGNKKETEKTEIVVTR